MKIISAAVMIALALSGCASAPTPTQSAKPGLNQPIPEWPESVAETCPKREISLECFRGAGVPREAVRQGFASLVERLHGCMRPDELPVSFKLRVETLAGAPTCVEPTVLGKETVRCVATVVARELRLAGSTPDEACGFTYPFKFQMSDEDDAP